MTINGIPPDFGELLTRLHAGMTLVVSKDVLQSWFPTDTPSREFRDEERAAAEIYAARFGCVFHYFPLGGSCEQGEGRFRKVAEPHTIGTSA